MKICITTIPHSAQAYPTVGNWWFDERGLHIFVSETGDERMNFLIGLHEAVEAMLCEARGIPEPLVAQFDKDHPELDDPGNDPRAPYKREHRFAEALERIMADALEVDWDEYGARVEAL